ncbi:MAG: hypothetical protein E7382_03535 [Clostridiales bacterium]|nr:hypothetical protein [Clostridiales bacterium]
MKRVRATICFIMVFFVLFLCTACEMPIGSESNVPNKDINESIKEETIPKRPITKLTLENKDTTLILGESLALKYKVLPENTDEELKISIGDTSVLEVFGDVVLAKKIGITYVSIKPMGSKTNVSSESFRVKVIKEISEEDFSSSSAKLKKATLKVYCKRYNTNWLGKEKDVHVVSGKGVIVKSMAYANYFLTDKSIFNDVATDYEHEEWYVIDYLGRKYSITGIHYHRTALIGIGTFTSTTSYPIASIYNSYAFVGDYAFSLGTPCVSRIKDKGYLVLSSNSTIGDSVFYHETSLTTAKRGEAIYNVDGEIIGVNVKFSNGYAIAVSAIEIRELYNSLFS